MIYLYLLGGILIVLLTIYDMIYTILSPKGSGFIADRISRFLWRGILKITGSDGNKKILSFIGPFIILIIVLT